MQWCSYFLHLAKHYSLSVPVGHPVDTNRECILSHNPCQVNPAWKVSQRKKHNMKSHKGHKDTKTEASLEGRIWLFFSRVTVWKRYKTEQPLTINNFAATHLTISSGGLYQAFPITHNFIHCWHMEDPFQNWSWKYIFQMRFTVYLTLRYRT